MVHSMPVLLRSYHLVILSSRETPPANSAACPGGLSRSGTTHAARLFVPACFPLGVIFQQIAGEIVHLAFRNVFGYAVTLLNLADQLLALSLDHLQIAVGQLSPLLPDFSGILFPFTFHLVPIHVVLPGWIPAPCARRFDGPGRALAVRSIEKHFALAARNTANARPASRNK